MPLSQDIVTRIVNVQWSGGGTFVTGDVNAAIRVANIKTSGAPPTWLNVKPPEFNQPQGNIFGSSFAKISITPEVPPISTFIVVGQDNLGSSGEEAAAGIIMTSNDGKAWTQTFSLALPGDPFDPMVRCSSAIQGVVWNEQDNAFYASGQAFRADSAIYHDPGDEFHPPSDTKRLISETFWDILLKSSDGRNWTEVVRTEIAGVQYDLETGEQIGDLPAIYSGGYKGALVDFIPDRQVYDDHGYPVPDGNYGYKGSDPEVTIVAPQNPITIEYGLGGVSLAARTDTFVVTRITSVTEDGGLETVETMTNVGFGVSGVAIVGNIWVAAGGNTPVAQGEGDGGRVMAARWSDKDKEWQIILDELQPVPQYCIITTITAGPSSNNAGL